MSKSTTINAPDFDGHRWQLGNGAVVSVKWSLPTRLQYGENLDVGFDHMPAVAGLEILRLSRLVRDLEEELNNVLDQHVRP